MRPEDLLRSDPGTDWLTGFPDFLELNGARLPYQYRFSPGEADDGVTLQLPVTVLGQLTPGRVDRVVPGLLREKITLLIKGLPKSLRRHFVPVPDFAERCLADLPESDAPLVQTLGELLRRATGVQVPEDAWNPEQLPVHLQLRIRLTDPRGGEDLAVSRDLAGLQVAYSSGDYLQRLDAVAGTADPGAMTDWTCGELPAQSVQQQGRMRVTGFPALVDCGDHVEVRVFDGIPGARESHHRGLRRLLLLREAKQVRLLKRSLPAPDRLRLHAAALPDGPQPEAPGDIVDDIVAVAVDRAFIDDAWTVRDAAAFALCRRRGGARLDGAFTETAGLAAGILADAHRLRRELDEVKQRNWQASVADMRWQLDSLVWRGFLVATPYERLAQLPRYIAGIAQRLEKLPGAAARDQQRMQDMAPVLQRWRERATHRASHRATHQEGAAGWTLDPRLDEVRWMLEELRISLFAQELKAAMPVSVKRIARRWDDLGL
jgi:ATP-dependent helicase HrpA